jgi:hypothetical protein
VIDGSSTLAGEIFAVCHIRGKVRIILFLYRSVLHRTVSVASGPQSPERDDSWARRSTKQEGKDVS